MDAQNHRRELLRLVRTALDRPHGQLLAALAMSAWTLGWIGGQVLPGASPSAFDVLGELLARLGLAGEVWSAQLAEAWSSGAAALPVVGGLLWAATTERQQSPALFGWVAVLLGSGSLDYRPALVFAVLALVAVVGVLCGCATLTGNFVDRNPVLVPADVLRAGVVAAALTAVVPLLLPLQLGAWLFRAYATLPPRRLPRSERSARGGRSATLHDPATLHDGEAGPRSELSAEHRPERSEE
ncbi:hypothetical protein [Bounagaea algeriensis]